jgi:hypothetical protein
MAWTRLDDQFFANPKIVDLSKDAKLLYLCAVTYSAGQLTDGRITPGALRMVAAMVDAERSCADELVAAGLWSSDGNDFLIHDFLEYNPTGAEVRARRQADRDRKRPHSNEGIQTDSARNPNGNGTDSKPPVPTPVPVSQVMSQNVSGARSGAPNADAEYVAGEMAEILVTAPFVGDSEPDVIRQLLRVFDMVPEFPIHDGPALAEIFVNWRGYGKKPPERWHVALLRWMRKEVRASRPPAVNGHSPPNEDDELDDMTRRLVESGGKAVLTYAS